MSQKINNYIMNKETTFDMFEESLTLGSNNSMDVGGTGTSFQPKKVSFLDLIDHYNKMEIGGSKAAPVVAYPIQNDLHEHIADAYTSLQEVGRRFKGAAENPIIKDNEKASKTAIKVYKKVKKIQAAIRSLGDDFEDLVV